MTPVGQRLIDIPDAQRIEYNASFEHLHRMIVDVDSKLPHFAVLMKEEVIKKIVLMVSFRTESAERSS